MTTTPLKAAATERATRTLWQGLAIDVAIAIAAALLAWLPDADVLDGAAWLILATMLVKTVLQAVASYVMRLKLTPLREAAVVDGSHVITDAPGPLPQGTHVRHTTELVTDDDNPEH